QNIELKLADTEYQLQRGLKSRHIQFLALGGAIGTGLFIGSGRVLAQTGPGPLFLGYCSMMIVVWLIMGALAEMVVYLPLRGITVPYLVNRYLDPSLAFASGWNYWYLILIAAEASAVAIIIECDPGVNIALWIAIVLIVTLILNIVAVSWFGESEFWFASIKLITITGLIILGICIFFGAGPAQDGVLGFRYWNNPGAFVEYRAEGSTGRFLAYWRALIGSGFAFIASPELIANAAGETDAPRRNVPKAASRFIYRLAVFYGLGSLVIGVIVPYTDERLLGASDASASPFVLGIRHAGIPVLNHIINAAVLTSAWSAGNAFLYSGSRVLYTLALDKQAPKIFTKTNKRGVPWAAVLVTWAVGLLAFLSVSNSGTTVFNWLVNITTLSGFLAWIMVLATYIRWRQAMQANGLLDTRPYKSPLQPYASYFLLGFLVVLSLTSGFYIFIDGYWNVEDFVATYVTIPIVLALYLGHKLVYRTRWAIPINEIDVTTGKQEMDNLEAMDAPPVPKNLVEKVWYWIA
ncbi:amino acid permease/ SLC12A domain-containing protein, partial [Stachybotrys elegans]